MLRYSKASIALGSLAAALWAAAIALLIGQCDGVVPVSIATIVAIIALAVTVLWNADRVAARLAARDTRPPIVVHADWNMDLASRTTIMNSPRTRRVVSFPVPVPSCASPNETTLKMRLGRQPARETVDESTYFAAFDAVAEDVLGEFDPRGGGAETVQ